MFQKTKFAGNLKLLLVKPETGQLCGSSTRLTELSAQVKVVTKFSKLNHSFVAGSVECPTDLNDWYYLKNNSTKTWTPTAEFDEQTGTSIDRINIMCVHPNCCHKIDVKYNSDNPDPEKVCFNLHRLCKKRFCSIILQKF